MYVTEVKKKIMPTIATVNVDHTHQIQYETVKSSNRQNLMAV